MLAARVNPGSVGSPILSTIGAVLVAIALYAAGQPGAGRATPDAGARGPGPSGLPPVILTIENPYPRPFEPALVQGGIPFAPGAVTSPEGLQILDADGQTLDLQARALAFWPDGSVKWAELTFYLPTIPASGRASATLQVRGPGATPPGPASAPGAPALPGLRLEDRHGVAELVPQRPAVIAAGPLCDELEFTGAFADREASTRASIYITRFPRTGAVRYRLALKQLVDGGIWKRLSFALPHAAIAVVHAEDMGARVGPRQDQSTPVTLIGAAQPVDRGCGRCWEVWGFRDETLGQPRPLRPFASPAYTAATGAWGDFVTTPPADWDRLFDENADRVFSTRAHEARNTGWPSYGAFFDREHGLAYYGYLNAEYDPATALWLAWARRGSPECFDRAEILSAHFRDMNVAPDGGVYEHRATWNSADAQVIAQIAPALERRLAASPAYSPSPPGLAAAVRRLYGEPAGRAVERILQSTREQPFADQQLAVVQRLAGEILKASKERALRGIGRLSEPQERRFPIRDLYRRYAADPELSALGFSDPDAAFEPFFARYGGSWDDFPALHVDVHPDPAVRHGGGHSLAEMLVLAYFATGDESYRATALTIARHHVDDLVPRMLARYEPQVRTNASIDARDLAWPLINLLALADLTEGRDAALNAQIRDRIRQLVAILTQIPPAAIQGSIHAGIGLEALCRYHERTHDGAAADYIVRLARYWAARQWNSDRRAFNLNRDQADSASTPMNGLLIYGLAYAHDLSPDPALRARVLETYESLRKVRTAYAKEFAQIYRSTPRAAAIIGRWNQP